MLDVVSFDLGEILLETELGMLHIKGKDLHVNRLDLQKGEVEIDGQVETLNYSQVPGIHKKGGTLRIIRRVFLHGIIWISVEDFFYWLAVSVYFFLRLCQVNDGIIRAFIVLGMVFGAWVYYLLCSRHFMRWFSRMIFQVKKQLKKWCKLVTIRVKMLKRPKKSEESETENE